jgi:hypothetical protein
MGRRVGCPRRRWRCVVKGLIVAACLALAVAAFSVGLLVGQRDASTYKTTCSHGIRVWTVRGGVSTFPTPDCPVP